MGSVDTMEEVLEASTVAVFPEASMGAASPEAAVFTEDVAGKWVILYRHKDRL